MKFGEGVRSIEDILGWRDESFQQTAHINGKSVTVGVRFVDDSTLKQLGIEKDFKMSSFRTPVIFVIEDKQILHAEPFPETLLKDPRLSNESDRVQTRDTLAFEHLVRSGVIESNQG